MTQTVRAKLKYLKITPKKVRPIASVIKGMPVERAIAELESRGRRANPALLALLRSAVANAVNVHKLDRDALVVKSILVDPGPVYKRSLPRAMGSATPLLKRTSHVTVILEAVEGLKLKRVVPQWLRRDKALPELPGAKVTDRTEKHEFHKPKPAAPVKASSRRSFMPKIFQRKAI